MTLKKTDRENQILDHIGTFWFSLRPIVQRLYFDKPSAVGNVVTDLKNEKLIRLEKLSSSGSYKYLQLTKKGADRRGFSGNRARNLKAAKFNERLAILWYCCAGDKRRHLVDKNAFRSHTGFALPPVEHCIERVHDQQHRLSRITFCTPKTDFKDLISRLSRYTEDAIASVDLGPWITSRQYGIVILVDDDPKAVGRRFAKLQSAIKKAGLRAETRIDVARVPSHATISIFLSELKACPLPTMMKSDEIEAS